MPEIFDKEIFDKTFSELIGDGKLSEESRPYLKNIYSCTNRFRNFTPLQENAFSNDDFWNPKKHLMIRGATSSGKTLVAEMAMLQALERGKSAIYLSPLRAMVTEKHKSFLKHLADFGRICASDKDHQNDDYYIVEGEAKVSVVVYEKFYAFLAQGNAKKILEKCGIIVFDEIQMIANEERGVKIIMSLLNILAQRHHIRMVFMTTSYSDMTSVVNLMQRKLNMDVCQISDNRNSMALEEIVLYRTGQFRGKYSPSLADRRLCEADLNQLLAQKEAELSTNVTDIHALKTHIRWGSDVTNTENGTELKRRMLYEVIKANKGKKIIVFINSRQLCRQLAEHIKEAAIFPRTELSDALLVKLQNLSATKIRDALMNDLMPYGVAYHHGGLSQAYRDIIENEFERGCLNVLFATETLAIGVNLPADVIIVSDTKKHNEKGEKVDIDAQTYKNYIGRAGRLGVTNDETPRSYLLALERSEMNDYWKEYVDTQPTRIEPAYETMKFDEILPYFLSMLSNETYDEEQLENKLKTHFPNLGGNGFFQELLRDDVRKPRRQWACGEIADDHFIQAWDSMTLMDKITDDDFDDDTYSYRLSHFGMKVIPYALSIFSCYKIWNLFANENSRRNIILKENLVGDFSETSSALSVLYAICKFPELERFRKLNATEFKDNSTRYYKQKDALIAYFQALDQEGKIPEGSDLKKAYQEMSQGREGDGVMTAMWRAFVFDLWMQEKKLEEIEKKIGVRLPDDFEEGDMERLADVAGFVIEAISDSVLHSRRPEIRNSSTGFRKLSSRIRYGGADDVVKILNCHVYGLSRDMILNLKQCLIEDDIAQKNVFAYFTDEYDDMTWASAGIHEEQYKEIRETLKKRYADGKVQKILYTMRGEGLLYEGMEECLEDQELKLRRVKDFLTCTSRYEKLPYMMEDFGEYYRLSSGYQRLYCAVANVTNVTEIINKFEAKIKERPGQWVLIVEKSICEHPSFEGVRRHFTRRVSEATIAFYTPEALLRLYLQCLTCADAVHNPFIYNLCENEARLYRTSPPFKLPKTPLPSDERFDVFVSYSHRANNDLPQELYGAFLKDGKKVFLDLESIHKGDNFVERIICGLSESQHFICLLNQEYTGGKWTNTELTAIYKQCVEQGRKAIFVALDDEGFRTITENPILGTCNIIDGRRQNRAALIRTIIDSING